MRISFFGHSSFYDSDGYKDRTIKLLEELIGDKDVEFYLGCHGGFDRFAYSCCKEYKRKHASASLILVTPYITESAKGLHAAKLYYDAIIYPPIENVPPKFAIVHRNRYMVDCSDVVIFYINHPFGGAYNIYTYALRKKKEIYNIYEKDF